MKKYCMIQHPIQGKIPFELYDFQEKTIKELQDNRMNVILKGKSVRYIYIDSRLCIMDDDFPTRQECFSYCDKTRCEKFGTKVRVMRKSTELVETKMC